jgi:heme A synthase
MPMTFLYHAHSGLRYLVLLAGVIAIIYFAYAFFSRRSDEKLGRVLMSAFVGVLDLQILLGILLVIGGIYYPMLIGHLSLMVLAAVAGHVFAVLAKRATDAASAHRHRLIGTLLALALIVAGISAIGRGLFETRAPMIALGLF